MCGIWMQTETNELTLQELDRILSDPLFSRVEYINVNGGEPNLREDLVELTDLFILRFSRLKGISLNSNGLPPDKMVENAKRISTSCQKHKIRFSVSISLHQIGKKYDTISGVKDVYFKVMQALDGLAKINRNNLFYLSVNCVITALNLHSVEEMLDWSKDNRVPINFTLGEVRDRFHNLAMAKEIEIKERDQVYLAWFLRKLAKRKTDYFQHALRYAHLADMIEFSAKRTLACHYALGGVILGSDGLLYYCKNSKTIGNSRGKSPYEIYFNENNLRYWRESLIRDQCFKCPPNTFNGIEVQKDLLKVTKFLFS